MKKFSYEKLNLRKLSFGNVLIIISGFMFNKLF